MIITIKMCILCDGIILIKTVIVDQKTIFVLLKTNVCIHTYVCTYYIHNIEINITFTIVNFYYFCWLGNVHFYELTFICTHVCIY